MKPIIFDGHDAVLGAPAGWDAEKDGECLGLPIMRDRGRCTSLWQPDSHERMAIASGANVWLKVFSDQTQPPVSLHVGRVVVGPSTVDSFRVVIVGDGTTYGTNIIEIESHRPLQGVESFTLTADAQSGMLLARLVVHEDVEWFGEPLRDPPIGLGCMAFVGERVRR